MNHVEILLKRLVATTKIPGDDGTVQEGVEPGVVKIIKRAFQHKNFSLSKGELTEELQSWIREDYIKYKNKIASIMGKGTRKTEYMYYGMVFTILQYNGFFSWEKMALRLTSPVANIVSCSS